MFAAKRIRYGTWAIGVFLGASTSVLSGTPALASGWASVSASIQDEAPTAGNFDDGYQFGLRNGGILASRLEARTTGSEGCSAVDQLQSALIRVARSIRPPQTDSDEYVAGFYSGYLDAIRGAVAEARGSCDESPFTDGAFAGQLYGAVACQVATISLTAVSSLQLQPLYAGWSGQSADVQGSCRTTLLATLESCSSGAEVAASINASIQVSCSDTSSSF